MPIALAYLNWGRWLADCPFGCGGAERVEYERMICRECGQGSAVMWPDDVAGIERATSARLVRNRNWMPQETIGDLMAENVEHMGVGA